MRFRLTAFGLHLLGSAGALSVTLGALYLGWYRWPGWYLSGALRVVVILLVVDLVLGPSLTGVVANPAKPRRSLARDVGIIVAVQLIALVYGAATLWRGRPLYYTFSVNRLEMVQAAGLDAAEVARARARNAPLAPYWYSRPRWVWAPLPDDPAAAVDIAQSAALGGADVIQMPRYFKPWAAGLAQLRPHLQTLAATRELDGHERQHLQQRMTELGLPSAEANTMLLWSDARRVLVVFDAGSLRIRALLRPD